MTSEELRRILDTAGNITDLLLPQLPFTLIKELILLGVKGIESLPGIEPGQEITVEMVQELYRDPDYLKNLLK